MARSRRGHKYVSGLLTFGLVLLLLLVAVSVGAMLSYSYVKRVQENFKNPKEIVIPASERMYIDIPRGSRTGDIADILEENGLIKYAQVFKILSKINGYDGSYKSGTHIVSKDLNYEELMMVLKGNPEILRLTFPEGMNARQFYQSFSDSALTHGKELKQYIEAADTEFDYAFLAELPARPDRLEGYLFPDTYDFDLNATPKQIIAMFLDNFERKLTEEHYARADEIGLTMDQVIILASIIEREAKSEADRFLVSGVFHNRLNSADEGMRRLQSCATIQYVYYQRNGIMLRRISDGNTKIVDPYNTYLHAGLPPGPISNPGISSINAALYPEETDYLYFVARGDGTHVFSRTYEEHQAAILEYGLNLLP
ncbi:MAG: endolytic transglycosylase MltG [Clostridiales bacterium]|jgi:UPF0755 protein|nr:endolytic transglycosylase MltG [Clostridiales bacterium]